MSDILHSDSDDDGFGEEWKPIGEGGAGAAAAAVVAAAAAGAGEPQPQVMGISDSGRDYEHVVQCLFCDTKCPGGPAAAWRHAKDNHNFDFSQARTQIGADKNDYSTIRLINFIRHQTQQGLNAEQISALLVPDAPWLAEDNVEFLKPVLPRDPLLFLLADEDDDWSEDEEETQQNAPKGDPAAAAAAASGESGAAGKDAMIARLLQENMELQKALGSMRSTVSRVLGQSTGDAKASGSGKGDAAAAAAENVDEEEKKLSQFARQAGATMLEQGYFDGYSERHIHEVMLRDAIRTQAYRSFILGNAEQVFGGKVVLDIGCGTGILSMFAASAGAKHVIGIDNASIVEKAKVIVADNGLSDKITLVRGKVEELDSLPGGFEKVDVIISEWMGYFLLFESMLETVLYARDKWLAKGGAVYPNKSIMYACGIEAGARKRERVDWWRDVYGFDMSSLIDPEDVYGGASIEILNQTQLLTNVVAFHEIDIMTATFAEGSPDLDFTKQFDMTIFVDQLLDGIAVWFDTDFDLNCSSPIRLPTGPQTQPTHWKQTVLYLVTPLAVTTGQTLYVEIQGKRNKTHARFYDIVLRYCLAPLDNPGSMRVHVIEYTLE